MSSRVKSVSHDQYQSISTTSNENFTNLQEASQQMKSTMITFKEKSPYNTQKKNLTPDDDIKIVEPPSAYCEDVLGL